MRREAETQNRERERVREGAVSLQRARVLQSGARARGVEKEGDEGTDAVSDAGVDRLLFGALLLMESSQDDSTNPKSPSSTPTQPSADPKIPAGAFPNAFSDFLGGLLLGDRILTSLDSAKVYLSGQLGISGKRERDREREALGAKLVQTASGSVK